VLLLRPRPRKNRLEHEDEDEGRARNIFSGRKDLDVLRHRKRLFAASPALIESLRLIECPPAVAAKLRRALRVRTNATPQRFANSINIAASAITAITARTILSQLLG
jgi:hypothetical protein